jgi:DNA-binding NtrC family response regulator
MSPNTILHADGTPVGKDVVDQVHVPNTHELANIMAGNLNKTAVKSLHHPTWALPGPADSKTAMTQLLAAVKTVYKQHWMSAMLCYSASLLPAINVKLQQANQSMTNRPIVVLHGEPGSGKTTCGYAITYANARPKEAVVNGEIPTAIILQSVMVSATAETLRLNC